MRENLAHKERLCRTQLLRGQPNDIRRDIAGPSLGEKEPPSNAVLTAKIFGDYGQIKIAAGVGFVLRPRAKQDNPLHANLSA